MNDHYLQHYRILGVQPGCSFRDLKYAYRRLVKNWHPDHFTVGHESGDLALAEARIKEINKAFLTLSNYYKKNGYLPISSEEAARQDIGDASFWPDGSQTSDHRSSQHKKAPTFSASLRFMIIGAALGIVYVVWNAYRQEEATTLDVDSSSANSAPIEQPQSGSPKQQVAENYFTVGSTLGDVIAIQGVPTKIEGSIWLYGRSKIYFEKGAVSRWVEDPANPLKAYIDLPPFKTSLKKFTIGSTKQDVREIQGTPLRETENTWEYHVSKVYFKENRVKGWYDSPLDPLKIHK